MMAYIIDENEEKTCSIYVPEIMDIKNGAKVNLVLNGKRYTFKAIKHILIYCALKPIDNISKENCENETAYTAFINIIDNWEKLYCLLKFSKISN